MIIHKQFYYIRHGQTDWNLTGRLQGNTDVPLNDTGIAQALEAKEKLAGQPIATICCSPLVRARKTADILNEILQCRVVVIDDLRECDFGPHEGVHSPDWLGGWLSGELARVPRDVEAHKAFIARTSTAINTAISRNGPVLIVAHGGTYQPINQLLPRAQQWDLPNCQPVRHDPAQSDGAEWRKTCL